MSIQLAAFNYRYACRRVQSAFGLRRRGDRDGSQRKRRTGKLHAQDRVAFGNVGASRDRRVTSTAKLHSVDAGWKPFYFVSAAGVRLGTSSQIGNGHLDVEGRSVIFIGDLTRQHRGPSDRGRKN